jgi:GNAT superfamily N-acetyltransferase
VIVRPAVAEDGDAIGRVQVETWRAAYHGLMPDEAIARFDVEAQQRFWRDVLARERPPGNAIFVAALDGEVVGFTSVGACRDEEGVGELYAIYLHPSCWDRGIGRALLERAEESLRSSGFTRAILWVMEGNERGGRFYRTAGWVQDDRKLDTFQGAEVAELRYRKDL